MNQEGATLSLSGMEAIRGSWSRQRAFILLVVLASIIFVVATIYLSVSAADPQAFAGKVKGVAADAARWTAMGEHYSAEVNNAKRGLAADVARWGATGEHYSAYAFDVDRSLATSAARWNALGARFAAERSAAAGAHTARYQAMADWHTSAPAAALTARYQAMADWYTSAPADARIARYQAMADWYTKQ